MRAYNSAYLGDNVALVCRDETCAVFKLDDETGEGVMTCYSALPGVDILYHDFHMSQCVSGFRPEAEMFCIDHCREGRLEWELRDGSCLYMEAGDMQINTRAHHDRLFRFPLRHYHGITVAIYPEKAEETLKCALDGFSVDLNALQIKFCRGDAPFIMRASANIDHIFSELYAVPAKIRAPFFRIKALELLLFLSVTDVPAHGRERPYFYKAQVEKVKAIMSLMTAHPEKRYTLDELSRSFDFPLTSMKACFRGVYGTSIYAYMKSYRMNLAAVRLRRTRESVTAIAVALGYDNASKFSAAFKSVLGATPAAYRKSSV